MAVSAADAITRLGPAWTGLVDRLTVAATPALDAVANALACAARAIGRIGHAIGMLLENPGRLASCTPIFAHLYRNAKATGG